MANANVRVVVITGASAGAGRASAIEFARHGWNVALIARGADGLEAAAREVRSYGVDALTLSVDVAEADAVLAAAESVRTRWGRLDVWVNCAMATVFGAVRDMTSAEYARVTQVTYLGYVHGTLAALREMRSRNAGTIVQVGSALAYRAIPLQSAYCAAKFAVRGFTDSLRSELIAESSAIRLCMVQLPAVNTPQFEWARNHMGRRPRPVAPVFQPEAIAREIYRAALRPAREVWIGRSTFQAILANATAPGIPDRVLARVAIRGQQARSPAHPGQLDNLLSPVSGGHGTHGRFDDEARSTVLALRPSILRGLLVVLAGLTFVALSSGGDKGRARRLRDQTEA